MRGFPHLNLFQLDLNKNEANYQLEVLKDAVAIRKKKTLKPLVKIEIEDTTLFNLYKKKLLLEEVLIQERIKLTGTKKNTEKLTQLLSKFLEN